MNPITTVRELVRRAVRVEKEVGESLDLLLTMHRRARDSELAPPLDPTFVYVLPPDGKPMMARMLRAPKGAKMHLPFQFVDEIPAGAWIVAAGPGTIAGVRVGNRAQESFVDFNGQVCRTRDPVQLGVILQVIVQG
ncbi:MAG TPA: hypothetical protein VNN80_03850 [Polyangiaceae bacterium]|nr:hypothetical protein [Polyangiaceae bacterium]HWP04469.1 hypothetical protein [Polyangiaceae bacterium]